MSKQFFSTDVDGLERRLDEVRSRIYAQYDAIEDAEERFGENSHEADMEYELMADLKREEEDLENEISAWYTEDDCRIAAASYTW